VEISKKIQTKLAMNKLLFFISKPKRIYRYVNLKIFTFFKKLIDYFFLRMKGVTTSFGYVKLKGFPQIKVVKGSEIIIEEGVTLTSSSKINPSGICHPVILETLNKDAKIIIKKDTGLSGATICAAKYIELGEYVGLGSNVSIFDTDFHAIKPWERRYENEEKTVIKPVIVNDYVWVGANSIILKGVEIGYSSVIAAGSVVVKNVDEFCIFGGNPAKFISKINNSVAIK